MATIIKTIEHYTGIGGYPYAEPEKAALGSEDEVIIHNKMVIIRGPKPTTAYQNVRLYTTASGNMVTEVVVVNRGWPDTTVYTITQ